MRGKRTDRWVIFGVFLYVALFWGSVTPMLAAERPVTAPDKKKVFEDLSLEGIKKKIGDLKNQINLARQAENEQTAEQMGVKLTDLQERTASLRSMESTYERFLTALNKKEPLKGEEVVLREKLKAQQQIGITQRPPYTLSFYDSILDELETAKQQRESTGLAIKLGRRSLEDATMRLENAQKELRIVKDRLEAITEKEKPRELKWGLEKAELEKKLAEALFSFEKVNHDNLLSQVKLVDLRSDISRRNIAWVREHLYFDKTDLDKQLETIEHRRNELKKRIQKLVQGKKQAEEALLTSQKRSASTTDKKLVPVAAAALKEHEAWVRTYQAVLEQAEDMLGFLGHQEQAWRLRYGLVNADIHHEKIASQRHEIENHIENLNRMLGVQQSFQNNLQSQITAVENRISEEGVDPRVKDHLKNEMKAMRTLAERPIKLGDLIEMEGNFAVVEEIGARCTRIRTGANVHILVPNSSFLKKGNS